MSFYYNNSGHHCETLRQTFNMGEIEGKTLTAEVWVPFFDLWTNKCSDGLYVFFELDGELSSIGDYSNNVLIKLEYPGWTTQNYSGTGVKPSTTRTNYVFSGYSNPAKMTVPINTTTHTLVAPTMNITVKHYVLGVSATVLDKTVTLTCFSDLDYSLPTLSVGTPDPSTDQMTAGIPNISAAHSLGIHEMYVYSLQDGLERNRQYLVRNGRDVMSYTNALLNFMYAFDEITDPENPDSPTIIKSYTVHGGDTITLRIYAVADTGIGAAVEKTITVPDYVNGIIVTQPPSVEVGDTHQLVWSLVSSEGHIPKIQTVTFSSDNTGVATVSSGGLITGVSSGVAHITVTSDDDRDGYDPYETHDYPVSTTVTVVVGSGGFPAFLDSYDRMTVGLMNDIQYALELLAEELSVTLTPNSSYNNYATWVKRVKPSLDTVNTNVKALCAAASVSHTLPSDFPYENTDGVWQSIVNQWVAKIQEIYEEVNE